MMSAMRSSSQHLTDLYAIESKGFMCRDGHPHAQHRAHWHSEIEINFLARGSITYVWQGSPITMESKSLCVFWGGLPHQVVDSGGDSECYWIYIPLPWFLQWRIPGEMTQALLNGQFLMSTSGSNFEADIAMVRRWNQDLQHADDELKGIVLLELEARMRRLALARPDSVIPEPSKDSRKTGGPLSRLELMAQLMAREYKSPLTMEQIAEAAGLHPNYACSLFSQACGISPHVYLNRLRITHAQRLLVTTDMKIIDIALDAGFTSLSRFYAAFTAACQSTPSDYRKRFLPPAP